MTTVLRFVLLAVALALAGCGTMAPREVKVPVAVKCDAVVPDVPVWATSALAPTAGIFDQVKTLLAEREQAIGYQDELRSALLECAEDAEDEEPEDDESAD